MNFDLTEDEEMLKALAERFTADRYDLDRRRIYATEDTGFSQENWNMLGEIGLIATAYSAQNGGLDMGPGAIAMVFEVLGRAMVVEPLADAGVLAGGLFERTAAPDLRAAWLEKLISGSKRLAFAHRESSARRTIDRVETRLEQAGDSLLLNGHKSLVPAGFGADGYIVSARTAGAAETRDGIALVFVPADTPGLELSPYRLVDGSVGVALTLRDVTLPAGNLLDGGIEAIEDALTRYAIAQGGEALGLMESMFAATLDYLRTRRQFGTPLGNFQALQHRMAALYARLEQSRALLILAVLADPADRDGWRRAVAGARAFIAETSLDLGHECIQMHGGMGVTDELPIGHGHKRLVMLSRYPGDADQAIDCYAGITA